VGGVREPSGVVIGGLFGTGKSSVAEEIATRLERDGRPYGALDLDWLGWFDVGSDEAHERVWLENVRGVVTNYLAAGVRNFVMAGTFWTQEEVDAFRAAVPFPLTFVELQVPWAEIERRLRSSPTSGRLDDLHEVRAWVESGWSLPHPDVEIDADRPIEEVAAEILHGLGWTA
jgi:gluconate kinase